MKVLLLVTGLSMGGAEKVVADLADALVATGSEVLLVYLKGPLQVRPRRPEVGLACLEMDSPWNVFRGYLKYRRLLRGFRPDIVHSHMFHATLLARMVRLSEPGQCLISTMHTAYDGGRLRALVYRTTDWLCDISTNVSHEAVDMFVARGAVSRKRMVAIHNGISTDRFRPSPAARAGIRATHGVGPDQKLFVAAGRLGWSKDYPNMFRALALLRDRVPFKLLIAGGGGLREELEALATDLGLSPQIEFLGIRDDINELMAAADVFVLSSAGEGFGLVVAEAMACECVVVATDSGGVREVLGEAGYLVPSRDAARLAEALLAACALPADSAAELGRAARQRVVDTYSFDRSLHKWRELYARVLRGPRREAFD